MEAAHPADAPDGHRSRDVRRPGLPDLAKAADAQQFLQLPGRARQRPVAHPEARSSWGQKLEKVVISGKKPTCE